MGKNVTYPILSLVVIVMVVLVVAIPIINQYATSAETIENDDPIYYLTIPDETIEVSLDDNDHVIINDVSLKTIVGASSWTNNQYVFMPFNCGFVSAYFTVTSHDFISAYVYYVDGTQSQLSFTDSSNTLKFENGLATWYVMGTVEAATFSYTDLLVPSAEPSEYGAYYPTSTDSVYVDSSTKIYFSSVYNSNISNASGTIEGMTFNYAKLNSTDYRSSTITIPSIQNDNGTFSINGRLTVSGSADLYGPSQSATLLFAPVSFNHGESNVLIAIIPLLLVVTTVLIAVRLISGRD